MHYSAILKGRKRVYVLILFIDALLDTLYGFDFV